MLYVSSEGQGECHRIQEAVDLAALSYKKALQKGRPWTGETIRIRSGFYRERVTIRVPKLTLIGEDSEHTILSYGLYGHMPCEDIGKRGTFRSYTMLIDADEVQLENLTVENSAGAGPAIGQAIALYADGDRLRFDRVRLLGWQDTLFTGPLPPQELEKNGFIGPKQFAPRRNGRQYYKDCWIEGDIDFIFGSATAYFDHCTIFQKDRRKLPAAPQSTASGSGGHEAMDHTAASFCGGYATAASTPKGQKYGYVFSDCRFLSDCPDGSCYLGRPWRNYAHVAILRSWLGPQIHPAGFHNWGKEEAETTVRFLEYRNEGPGAGRAGRAAFAQELTAEEAAAYALEKVMAARV